MRVRAMKRSSKIARKRNQPKCVYSHNNKSLIITSVTTPSSLFLPQPIRGEDEQARQMNNDVNVMQMTNQMNAYTPVPESNLAPQTETANFIMNTL